MRLGTGDGDLLSKNSPDGAETLNIFKTFNSNINRKISENHQLFKQSLKTACCR